MRSWRRARDFRLQDYRDVEGPFERIVSVGMFEHVGLARFDEYFSHVSRLLTDDGVMLLHAIGRSTGPGYTNPWVEKYIFPGGYIPAVSEVLASIEKFGLYRHRHRDAAPALRRHAEGVARAFQRAPRRGACAL